MDQLFQFLENERGSYDPTTQHLWRRQLGPSQDSRLDKVEAGVWGTVLNSLAEGLFVIDGTGKVKVFNESARRLLGGEVLEVGSPAWREQFVILDPETRLPLGPERCPFGRSQRGEVIAAMVLFLRTPAQPDGLFVELSGRPIGADPEGRLGAVFLFRDVSPREALAQKLGSERRRFETLAHLVNDMVWEWDGILDVTWRHNARQAFGYPPELVYGGQHWWMERIHPDDKARMMELFETVMAPNGPRSWSSEYRFRRADGTYAHILDHGGVMERDQHGRPLHLLGAMLDISSRKTEEEHHAQLAAIVDSADDAIVRSSLEGTIESWNRGAQNLYGYTATEMLGRSDALLLPADELEPFQRLRARVVAGEHVGRHEGWRVRKSGERFLVSETLSPVRSGGGSVIGVCGIGRDITAVHQKDADLKQLAATLARSNEELERFAHIASHDLREPLRNISTIAMLFRREYGARLEEAATEYLDLIVDGAKRMHGLVEGILAYSKIDHAPIERRAVDGATLLADVRSDLAMALREAECELIVEELPPLWGEATLLRQLFQNLVSNSVKFRHPSAPRIVVGATQSSDGWIFSVRDNGIGIPETARTQVFDVFRRLHTRDEYPGAGLGLATCKKIVERHGGRIWIAPPEGRGTTVCFTLH